MATIKGGAKLEQALRDLSYKVSKAATLRVGFLEGAVYPSGTPVAAVAAINEFGGRVEVEPHDTIIYRKVDKDGEFAKGGRFVKKDVSNFATDHYVGAHVITIPPRPFFRNMVAGNSDGWPDTLAKSLKATNYDVDASMGQLGIKMVGQLKKSINDFTTPPNAPSTIARKGFDKPLIESSHMVNSVDYDIQS